MSHKKLLTSNFQLLTLKDGAWLIADAHYAHYNTALYDFLSCKDEDLPPQLILMGDIFDLLFGNAPNSIEPNLKMVDLLKSIAKKVEVIYLEGNHDFGLKTIFGDSIKIVPRTKQPLFMSANSKVVALHHGDMMQGIGYEIYTALIRNRWIDRVLNTIDSLRDGKIIDWLERYNRQKKPCYSIDSFENIVSQRLDILEQKFEFDYWVEGHFHQNVQYNFNEKKYCNLPAFACCQSYIVVKLSESGINFIEKKGSP
ncbi:UDP-2,3-diacylglucosamine diphosphatase [Hydrogenimonas thermophila]|nr:metallophosphoesterase [Hydrogenimonas thermophila]WOE70636.1 metallophosphoesterase [Hydrogenimonas thermophila]WOE73154.1 metallophosphoesterase [Hydrogenimonas thermophila]